MKKQHNIRNFCIIAHIDHGKSTLADRLLEKTGTLPAEAMVDQVLDRLELERERGITIKAQAVKMSYKAADGQEYVLNLIDTPGHVDFSYEVSRSLAACEGALLVVDAAQGVEAQTVANAYLAINHNLEIIPVINKIDLPNANPEQTKLEIEEAIGIDAQEAILASAKTGQGTEEILEAIVKKIPAPEGESSAPLKALIFDSTYDAYRGVVAFVRVVDGCIKPKTKIKFMATGKETEVEEVGFFTPDMQPGQILTAGEVGYVITGLKNVEDVKVGDTLTTAERPAQKALPGYKEAKPMVYCGFYPTDGGQYPYLREALQKLKLNDAALQFEPESSTALGFGFRCGFLGLLHMEIVKERLEREYELDLVATAPTVAYLVTLPDGSQKRVSNPAELEPHSVSVEEPYIEAVILTPTEYVGPIMELCQNRRGQLTKMDYLTDKRVELVYELPLSEIVLDFYDQLKSRSKGYASLDYEFAGYKKANLIKLDILISGKPVDAFCTVVPKEKAYERGRLLVTKLKEIIPRQQFEVVIQAAIGSRVVARETIKAKRKDVIAKCYGGDITRKRKLLERQKEGKKRMKQIGQINIPQEAFLAVLKVDG